MRRLAPALGLGLLTAAGLAAPPAHARKPRPPALRVEDDPKVPGDSERFAKVQLTFLAPQDGEVLPASQAADGVRIALDVRGYALGPDPRAPAGAPRPHVLLLVDQGSPFPLEGKAPALLRGLSPGPHLLRALLVRPWPEVVKAAGAFGVVRFWVGPRPEDARAAREAEARRWPNPERPLLTLALPIAQPDPALQLVAESPPAQPAASPAPAPRPLPLASQARPKIVLDFFISGARLRPDGRDHKVRLVIDKKEHPLLRAWKPVSLALADGLHRITIDLLDARGTKVPNVLNRTDRTIEVLAQPPLTAATP